MVYIDSYDHDACLHRCFFGKCFLIVVDHSARFEVYSLNYREGNRQFSTT